MVAGWFEAIRTQELSKIALMFVEHHQDTIHEELPCECDALMYAAFEGLPDSLSQLLCLQLQHKLPDFGARGGITALMLACLRDNVSCASQLLFQKTMRSNKGFTALMCCAMYNAYNCCALLMPLEATITTSHKLFDIPSNSTALQIALRKKHKKCVDILLIQEIHVNRDEVLRALAQSEYTEDIGMNVSPQYKISVQSIQLINQQIKGQRLPINQQNPYQTPETRDTAQDNNELASHINITPTAQRAEQPQRQQMRGNAQFSHKRSKQRRGRRR